MKDKEKSVSVFWSWQMDSSTRENRNLIESALEKAIKKVAKGESRLIELDRDTKGLGGSPAIVDSILEKIRQSDVFVWDATLVHSSPKFSPNANVLMELGYALAVLGDSRIIGVMNTARSPGGEELPFDLKHRRWPIAYSYREPDSGWRLILGALRNYKGGSKKEVVESLEKTLQVALRDALLSPKRSAFQADGDSHIAEAFWDCINGIWMSEWVGWRESHPQYEKKEDASRIWRYLDMRNRSELRYANDQLQSTHDGFLDALSSYSNIAAREMAPSRNGGAMYVISTKESHWSDEYDENYERQCRVLLAAVEKVTGAWGQYVLALRGKYPSIVTSGVRVAREEPA